MQTVFVYEPDMRALSVNKSEIYRYLGYTKQAEVTGNIDALVDEVLENVLKGSTPKVCYKRFDLAFNNDIGIDFGFMRVESRDLTSNLSGCHEAVVFAATIGLYTDRQIQRETILSPAKACVYQAVGAAVIEAVCDDFNEWFRASETLSGNELKPRYSPGYGDVSLEVQKDIFRELNCAKMAGITLSDSLHMIPEKSVTAIIGIKKN